MKKRIIARIDTKNTKVIKGIRYEGVNVLGEINEFAIKYYEEGADEILYLDSVASLYDRISLKEIIENSTAEIFIPLTYGGGIKGLADAKEILSKGADKIAINTYAHKSPSIINEIASEIGSQSLVIYVQAKRNGNTWECLTDNGRENTGKEVLYWCKEAEKRGAGEILISSVDQDGTELGLDYKLIDHICNEIQIPVIVSGGARDNNEVYNCLKNTNCSAIAIGTALHKGKIILHK